MIRKALYLFAGQAGANGKDVVVVNERELRMSTGREWSARVGRAIRVYGTQKQILGYVLDEAGMGTIHPDALELDRQMQEIDRQLDAEKK